MSISVKLQLLTIWCVKCKFSNMPKCPVSLHYICNTLGALLHLPWHSLPPLGMNITQSQGIRGIPDEEEKSCTNSCSNSTQIHGSGFLTHWQGNWANGFEEMNSNIIIMIYALNSGLDSPKNFVTIHIVSWWTIFKVSSLLYKILSDEYKIQLSQKTTEAKLQCWLITD